MYQTTTEIAKEIRQNLKKEYPTSKFAVRKNHHSSITVVLKSSSEKILTETIDYKSINHYHVDSDDKLTALGKEFIKKSLKVINKRNWDNSDIQSDYFDVNFYLHMTIGEYDKPFIQTV